LPSIQNPLGSLPSRFRRPRVLIAGCGDVGLRAAAVLGPRTRVLALTSSPGRTGDLRARGIVPLIGNLDRPGTLRRLAGLAGRVLYLAPPPGEGEGDPRMRAFARVLRLRTPPAALVYASTSGVYGDCGGQLVAETRPLRAATPRAARRVAAEAHARFLGRGAGTRVAILRIPGIYAPGREGGTPRARLLRGTPVLQPEDDVYTNHIHADDLARLCVAAMWRGRPQRVYNANDDTVLKMGDYFDAAAGIYGLPRPPRISRAQAAGEMAPTLLSFMSESRRMDNRRMKRELRIRLRYPTIATGLR
jgi:nucleoside-diphosphate-sugar epimerase